MTINPQLEDSPDWEALSAVHRACFPVGWSAGALAGLFSVAGTVAAVARDGVSIAGFGIIRVLGEEGEILTLAASESHRRQGVGEKLLQFLCNHARGQGAGTIFLEVGEYNRAALALYEKSGFTVVSRRKAYYKRADGGYEDAIVMHRAQ